MKKFYSESQDESLSLEVAKLIHDLNERSERTKDHLVKIKRYALSRDIELKHALIDLRDLHKICYRDVEGSDDWTEEVFGELTVTRRLGWTDSFIFFPKNLYMLILFH